MFLGQAAGDPVDMGAGGMENNIGAFEEEALVLAQAAENQVAAAAAAAGVAAAGGGGGWGVMFGGGNIGWQAGPAAAAAHTDSIYHRSGSQWAMHAGVRGVPKPVDMSWTAVDGSFLEAARRLRGLYELC